MTSYRGEVCLKDGQKMLAEVCLKDRLAESQSLILITDQGWLLNQFFRASQYLSAYNLKVVPAKFTNF